LGWVNSVPAENGPIISTVELKVISLWGVSVTTLHLLLQDRVPLLYGCCKRDRGKGQKQSNIRNVIQFLLTEKYRDLKKVLLRI
jgi:hypothetical protein